METGSLSSNGFLDPIGSLFWDGILIINGSLVVNGFLHADGSLRVPWVIHAPRLFNGSLVPKAERQSRLGQFSLPIRASVLSAMNLIENPNPFVFFILLNGRELVHEVF
jgi:hypothetical protein